MLKKNQADIFLVAFLLLFCLGLFFLPTGYENRQPQTSHLARARIVAVDNSDLIQNLIVKSGSQKLEVEILEGPYRGQKMTAMNFLQGKMELDEVYFAGRDLLLEFRVDQEGHPVGAQARGNYRLSLELLLVFLFAGLLLVVGGWTGAKALLSFVFSALMLWKVLVPCFLKGYDPILTALAVVALLTAAISFLVGGWSRKGLVCFLGAFLGLILTSVLALLFAGGFRLHGAVRPFAETLLYSGFYHLDLTRIFLAGIFIASSGAVMDLAMDIAASMHEMREKNPRLGRLELMRSGLVVGRAVIGTMTTTLLLAYSGGYVTMFMFFMGQGVPIPNILNLNFVAAEILNTLVGSFGLVTVAPFTVLAGGLLLRPVPEKAPDGRK
ncbi:MAG: YibE/F family protein [Deltaproteobacteria bacterium]|nr:YibE/F family protein [Deltaproteobacteria bacterium]